MRPVSICWFDRLFVAALALSLPFSVLETWQSMKPYNAVYLLAIFVVPRAIDIVLWFFISRRASNIAKWLWVLWFAIPLISAPFLSIMVGGDFIGAFLLFGALRATVEVTMLSLFIAATMMLFRSDAAKWFTNRGHLVETSSLG